MCSVWCCIYILIVPSLSGETRYITQSPPHTDKQASQQIQRHIYTNANKHKDTKKQKTQKKTFIQTQIHTPTQTQEHTDTPRHTNTRARERYHTKTNT